METPLCPICRYALDSEACASSPLHWYAADQRGLPVTADLERRIARVLVGSQHPGLPPGKVDELVTLGVGRATAALIVEEIHRYPPTGIAMECDCCVRRAVLPYVDSPALIPYGTPVIADSIGVAILDGWETGSCPLCPRCAAKNGPPTAPRPPGGAERLGPIRHEPARPQPVTPTEVARLVEVLETIARPPEIRIEDLPEPDLSGSIEKLVSSDDGPDWALIKPWVRKHWWRR